MDSRPPVTGEVVRLDITTSSQRFNIPALLAGRLCEWTWYADTPGTTRCEVLFGGAAVSITANQDSGVASEVITPNAASGASIKETDPPRRWRMHEVTSAVTDFAVIGSAPGRLVISIVEG